MIRSDKFLSDIFGKPCGSVILSEISHSSDLKDFYFISSKSNYSTECSIKAKDLNFFLAQISVHLVKGNQDDGEIIEEIEFAKQSDIKTIQKLASESFIFDRFHKDPNISNLIASEIKRRWVTNYFLGNRGDKCFIVRSKNKSVIGFLLAVVSNNSIKIDLLAVDSKYRGKGIGKKLIYSMLSYYKDQYKNCKVETQLNNHSSLALYQSCGFSSIKYELVWHHFKK